MALFFVLCFSFFVCLSDCRLRGSRLVSQGREAAYRNPYKQVYQFLEKRHHGHYKVYNLCSEKNRQYDPAKFNNAMVCFPFDDHHPPPFELIEQFCIDLKQYLDEDPKNVAAIHW